MKILFVSPELPWPLDTGGKIRSFNILKNLAQDHKIVLLCFGENKDAGPLSGLCQKIILIPLHLNLFVKILNLARSIFSQKPMKVLNFYSKAMEETMVKTVEIEKPQILYFEHIYMAQYLENLKQKERFFKIFDTYNIYFRFFEFLAMSKNWLKALVNKTQINKMKNYEARLAFLFNLVCVCSEEDKKVFLDIAKKTKIEVIPNGIDPSLYKNLKVTKKENALVFVGSFDHFPNEEGILWFISKVFPKIKQKIENIKLYLIGRCPSRSVSALKKDKNIRVLGYVKDVIPFLLKSKVFIVPLLSGGGTRLKILEAMATRIPVVSTKIGAEGLEVLDNKNIFLTDSEDDFAQKIVDLLLDEKLSQRIIKNAHRLVITKYDWSICTKKLKEKLRQLN